MKVFICVSAVVVLLASCLLVAAAPSVQDNHVAADTSNSGTFSRVAKYLGACFESDDMPTCLAVKGITALNRAARSNNIELINGISFKRDDGSTVQRNGKALSEADIYAQLPAESEERSSRLVDLAMETATDFLGSHNLEVKVPAETTQEVARALDEGRGKIKKLIGPIILAVGAKLLLFIPIVLGGLALLTAKAVFVAKIAFLFALLAGGSRIFGGLGSKFGGSLGGGSGGYSNAWPAASTGGWSSGASSSYPYARSIDNNDDVQQLAYNSHAQE